VNRIHLGAQRKIVDARYQCKVETVRDMPPTINQSELVQLLTWNLWRVIRERNMVAGFTRYIAMEQEVKRRGKELVAGEWPLKPSLMPIHLYQKGFTLVWGGHGVNGKGGYLKEIGEEEHHQMVHSNYGELPYGGAERFGPMRGVSHPCTYNTPIQDYREIETYNVEKRKEGEGNDW
jgi:hypothetical protein